MIEKILQDVKLSLNLPLSILKIGRQFMSHRIFSYIAADILNPIRCLLFFTMEARDFLDLVKSYLKTSKVSVDVVRKTASPLPAHRAKFPSCGSTFSHLPRWPISLQSVQRPGY